MVFMSVGQDDAANALTVLGEIRNVRDNDIDTEQFGFRKHHSGVDDNNVIAPANGHAVHSKLAETAKGHQMQFSRGMRNTDRSTRRSQRSVRAGKQTQLKTGRLHS